MKVSSDEITVSIEGEIKNRLKNFLVNKHLGGDNQTINYPYLTVCVENWEKIDEQLKLVKELIKSYKDRRVSKEEAITKAHLTTQKAVLTILSGTVLQTKAFNDFKSLVNN